MRFFWEGGDQLPGTGIVPVASVLRTAQGLGVSNLSQVKKPITVERNGEVIFKLITL